MKQLANHLPARMILFAVMVLIIIGSLAISLGSVPLVAVRGQSTLPFPTYPTDYPLDKQTFEAGERATRAARELTPLPTGTLWSFAASTDTPIPGFTFGIPTDVTTPVGDGFVVGNGDSEIDRIGSTTIWNEWSIDTGGRKTIVDAGGVLDYPQYSVVLVSVWTDHGIQLPDGGAYSPPNETGALHIVGGQGQQLILRSVQGVTYYFDVPGEQFITALGAVVPTVTPVPVTPIPPTLTPTPTLTEDAAVGPNEVTGLTPVNTPLHFILYGPGEDWFRFHLAIPSTIQVHLTNLPADYDLYVYSVTRDFGAGRDGQSTNPGTTSELVVIHGAPVDDYMVRVVGVNGAFDPVHAYQLEFDVTPTVADLQAALAVCVTDHGIANSLSQKIDHQDWSPFINEVEAQNGKKIDPTCADEMIQMATYLLNNPPLTATATPTS